MKPRLSIVVALTLFVAAAAPDSTGAKGVGAMPSARGVVQPGSPYRYVAISPRTHERVTVVEKIDRDSGLVRRWWFLKGAWYVPAVAYDGSGGGLAANGAKLVLTGLPHSYPVRRSRFAILDPRLHLRHPPGAGGMPPRRAISRLTLRGDFSFDAISPDGSTIYLIEHPDVHHGRGYLTRYQVRAYDLERGSLLRRPVVDPSEPNEQMNGLPITRATSADGRWAYTLYFGNGKEGEPFLHALDTIAGRAVCVDLPQLAGRHDLFLLKLRMTDGGRGLLVARKAGGPSRSGRSLNPLLRIDTGTFAVARAGTGPPSGGGFSAWAAIALGGAGGALLTAWFLARRRSRPGPRMRTPEGA
ncbi:MAG TPA: hypothetical protein VGF04_01585 [Solirubrobacterales bacterium]|jgi:hypothetical protein